MRRKESFITIRRGVLIGQQPASAAMSDNRDMDAVPAGPLPKRERSACRSLALSYSSRETVMQSVRGAGAAETWLTRSINPAAVLEASAMGFFRLI
jgi:hypothetical protein